MTGLLCFVFKALGLFSTLSLIKASTIHQVHFKAEYFQWHRQKNSGLHYITNSALFISNLIKTQQPVVHTWLHFLTIKSLLW